MQINHPLHAAARRSVESRGGASRGRSPPLKNRSGQQQQQPMDDQIVRNLHYQNTHQTYNNRDYGHARGRGTEAGLEDQGGSNRNKCAFSYAGDNGTDPRYRERELLGALRGHGIPSSNPSVSAAPPFPFSGDVFHHQHLTRGAESSGSVNPGTTLVPAALTEVSATSVEENKPPEEEVPFESDLNYDAPEFHPESSRIISREFMTRGSPYDIIGPYDDMSARDNTNARAVEEFSSSLPNQQQHQQQHPSLSLLQRGPSAYDHKGRNGVLSNTVHSTDGVVGACNTTAHTSTTHSPMNHFPFHGDNHLPELSSSVASSSMHLPRDVTMRQSNLTNETERDVILEALYGSKEGRARAHVRSPHEVLGAPPESPPGLDTVMNSGHLHSLVSEEDHLNMDAAERDILAALTGEEPHSGGTAGTQDEREEEGKKRRRRANNLRRAKEKKKLVEERERSATETPRSPGATTPTDPASGGPESSSQNQPSENMQISILGFEKWTEEPLEEKSDTALEGLLADLHRGSQKLENAPTRHQWKWI